MTSLYAVDGSVAYAQFLSRSRCVSSFLLESLS